MNHPWWHWFFTHYDGTEADMYVREYLFHCTKCKKNWKVLQR